MWQRAQTVQTRHNLGYEADALFAEDGVHMPTRFGGQICFRQWQIEEAAIPTRDARRRGAVWRRWLRTDLILCTHTSRRNKLTHIRVSRVRRAAAYQ